VLRNRGRFAGGEKIGPRSSAGGNIDPLMLSRSSSAAWCAPGRLARVLVEVRDLPGSLAKVTACVAEQNANIEEVHHQRAFTSLAVQNAEVEPGAEDPQPRARGQIVAALQRCGFNARSHP
jgi:threonine dehydratase